MSSTSLSIITISTAVSATYVFAISSQAHGFSNPGVIVDWYLGSLSDSQRPRSHADCSPRTGSTSHIPGGSAFGAFAAPVSCIVPAPFSRLRGTFPTPQAMSDFAGPAAAGLSPASAHARAGRNRVVVVLGAQWGDEGKGKLVDLLCCGDPVPPASLPAAAARAPGAPSSGVDVVCRFAVGAGLVLFAWLLTL